MASTKKIFKIGVTLSLLSGVLLGFIPLETNAQEIEISGDNQCFTRLINRPNQQSLACQGGTSILCDWYSGKGRDKAACGPTGF